MFGFSKPDVYDALWGRGARRPDAPATLPVVAVNTLPAAPVHWGDWHGEKFPGGFGATEVLAPDYWTLRARSSQLFRTNLYARALLERLIDNEINDGLLLECTPEEGVLGFERDGLADWSEAVENRFSLWAASPYICDYKGESRFGRLQAIARFESWIEGDVLVMLGQHEGTGATKVRLVSGSKVQSPLNRGSGSPRIVHGVELDSADRHVAYWVTQAEGDSLRIPAWSAETGRRVAWLIYGTDKRHEDIRGEPLLSLMMQSVRELDRYRDSTQRKAVINSMLAMYIKRNEAGPGTRPIAGGAVRRSTATAVDGSGGARSFRTFEQIPGLILDELAVGEEPHGFVPNGTDEKFGDFEETILGGVAIGYGVPPEIYRLSFSSNYSASQAAINEFKMRLNRKRADFAADFCVPIGVDWMISESLARRIDGSEILATWRNPAKFVEFAAWTHMDWTGHIKPAVDLSRLVAGYAQQCSEGFLPRSRAASELNGLRYSKGIRILRRENEQLAEALAPLRGLVPGVSAPSAQLAPSDSKDKDEDDAVVDQS